MLLRRAVLCGLWVVCLVLLIIENGGKKVEGVRCSLYQPAPGLNELAYPTNELYNTKRTYFGAPAVCDLLSDHTAFFVPENGTNKEDVENEAFRSGLGIGTLSTDCRIAATKVLCASAFRQCDLYPFDSSLPNFFVFPLPRPPCRSLCDEMHDACKTAGIDLPVCKHVTDGLQDFPKYNATFVVDGVGSFQVPCQDYSNFNVTSKDLEPAVCPWPLDLRNYGNPPCQLVCPHFNAYSEDDYDKILRMRLAFAIVSLCLDVWTFLTLITIKEKRKFPANLSICVVSIHTFWMIITLITSGLGVRNVICENRFDFATQYSPVMCGIEGPIMMWSVLMMTFLWVTLGLQLWCYVVLEKTNRELLFLWLPVYIVCFGVPTVNVIIAYSAQKFLAEGIFPHCWPKVSWWDIPLVFIPLTICNAILLIAILWTFIKLIQVKRHLMSIWQVIYKHSNLLIFSLGFATVEVYFISQRYWEFTWEDRFSTGLESTVECNAKSGLNNCRLPDKDNFPFELLESYVSFLYGNGIIVFLAFGCSFSYIKHWQNILTKLKNGEFRELRGLSIVTQGGSRAKSTHRSSKSKSKKDSSKSEHSARQQVNSHNSHGNDNSGGGGATHSSSA